MGVGMFVGSRQLQMFILPVITEALADEQEFVISKVGSPAPQPLSVSAPR